MGEISKTTRLVLVLRFLPYACHSCSLFLLAAVSLRRLHAKTGIDTAGLDRLRAWHHDFFRYAQLLSPGRRYRRDAAGQYLTSDEIRLHSGIPRRLAFVCELLQVLSLPPLMPPVYPVADVTPRGGGGPLASAFRPSRCAWAVHEGVNPITSPADHRPNRVGKFTSTLLGKLRPTLTEDWLLRHFIHALDETWRAWRAMASDMQKGGSYVVSPLLFPPRLLWTDCSGDGDGLGAVDSLMLPSTGTYR
jgi:hypothetical protein